jgi:hypothetical protein
MMVGLNLTRRTRICLAAIFAVAAVLLGLTGCGKLGENYTYIEWSTSYFEKYYVRWFDDFEKLHADQHARIKFRAMPSNAAQGIYTMMISHTLSDVVTSGTGISALLFENNAFEPVPAGLIDESDFMPVAMCIPRYPDGTLAGVPGGVGIRPFIYFDSADLKEAGASVSEIPQEYDAYREWAQKLFKREVDGKITVGPLPPDQAERAKIIRRPLGMTRGHLPSFYPFMLAYLDPMPDANGVSDNSLDDYVGGPGVHGTRPFKFDSPEFIKGLDEWRKFFVPAKTAIADGGTERLFGLQSDLYAGCEAGNWIFGEVYTTDMLVSPLPHAPGRPQHLYCEAGAEGVSRDSKNKALAFEWVKYITATEQQVDAYYGHGYTPGRLSTYKWLADDDKEDQEIRRRFLGPYSDGNADFICQPSVARTSHDTMDVFLFVALPSNAPIVKARSWEEQVATGAAAEEAPEPGAPPAATDIDALAARHAKEAKELADKIAAMTKERVTVIVQGTPPELVAFRNNIRRSPIPTYLPLLAQAVYQPDTSILDRIASEVLARAIQDATSADSPRTAEEVAKWCQKEAEDIAAGRK